MCVINNVFSPIKLIYFDGGKKALEIAEQCQDLYLLAKVKDTKNIPFIHTLLFWKDSVFISTEWPR